ncbi:MAG: hypothetical protein ACI841_004864 [Planctomycetota bacterium]|jgi:hypothetical protein
MLSDSYRRSRVLTLLLPIAAPLQAMLARGPNVLTAASRASALALLFLITTAPLLAQKPDPVPGQVRPLFKLVGQDAGDRFGHALAAIADANFDQRVDWAVGSPKASRGAPGAGSVTLYSGADCSILWRVDGQRAWARFGWAIAATGDVDRDGTADVLVGAPMGANSAGEARLLSGRSGKLIWRVTGSAPGEQFGTALAGVGDVDGDGIPDMAIAAPFADGSAGSKCGRVSWISGRDASTLRTREGAAWEFFGSSLAATGDTNQDGITDLLVGVPFSDVTNFNAGSAYVYSGADGSELLAFHGSGIGDQLGTHVAGGQDVNGDGIADCALGAPGADRGGIDAGRVRVHSGLDGALIHAIDGEAAGDGLHTVALLGDLDADGKSEWVAGAPSSDRHGQESGSLLFMDGASGLPLQVLGGAGGNAWLGASLTRLGDWNGDGRPEFLAGAPGHDDQPRLTGSLQSFGLPR